MMDQELHEHALARTRSLRLAWLRDRDTAGEARAIEGLLLEVELWQRLGSIPGRRVAFLLGYGGPSDGIEVDLSTHRVSYWYSWGGESQQTVLPETLARPWVGLAEDSWAFHECGLGVVG